MVIKSLIINDTIQNMGKFKLSSVVFLVIILANWVSGDVLAAGSGKIKDSGRTLVLPPAADFSDTISLGEAVDPRSGAKVEGLMFIHHKKEFVQKPSKGSGTKAGAKCYAFLAKGAKWKIVEPWVMNPSNIDGVNETTLFNLMDGALGKWEDATDGVVGNGSGVAIFGAGTSTTSPLTADSSSPDGQNEVYFADISSTGAIAVTIVWGIFSGPSSQRKLVEWDMVFDDVDFDWSAEAAAVSGKMDFDNIATHEDGHAAGMGHPSDSCTEETMYRFASTGETKKRDLNTGDITGINNLY